MLRSPWVHSEPSRPCPICGRSKRGNRCILIPGKVAQCYYVESKHPARSSAAGQAWRHPLGDDERPIASRIKSVRAGVVRDGDELEAAPRRNDLHLLAQKFRSRITTAKLDALARELGVSVHALTRLDAGWADGEPMHVERLGREVPIHAWSFPRRNAGGDVIGLNMRAPGGRKFAFTGSGGGLHIPHELTAGGRGVLCEGPSDTAAAIDLGLNVFGRTSCSSDVDHVTAFVERMAFDQLVIFSQLDDAHYRRDGSAYYPAQDGAAALENHLRPYLGDVRVITPPRFDGDKDVRDWKRRGATIADVERLVAEARPQRVSVLVNIRPKKKGNGVPKCHTIQP